MFMEKYSYRDDDQQFSLTEIEIWPTKPQCKSAFFIIQTQFKSSYFRLIK